MEISSSVSGLAGGGTWSTSCVATCGWHAAASLSWGVAVWQQQRPQLMAAGAVRSSSYRQVGGEATSGMNAVGLGGGSYAARPLAVGCVGLRIGQSSDRESDSARRMWR